MSSESDDSSDSYTSSDSCTPPVKRPRFVSLDPGGPDRLSTLPESVILHILSFLSIRDSVRTGLLSRSWQYLWTCVPTLSFNYDDYYDSDEPETSDIVRFAEFVVKTLVLSDGFVKNLAITFLYRKQFSYHANLWARFASKHGVDKFESDFKLTFDFVTSVYGEDREQEEGDSYILPQFLFTDSKFRELHFSWCRIEPKHTVDWNSLKKLSIGYVTLSDDVIQMIIAGTPVLEMLELHNFKGIDSLHFGESSVKRLVLRDICMSHRVLQGLDCLEISAPNVLSLEMSGVLMRCQLVDLNSLVEATLFGFYLGDAEVVSDDELINMAQCFLDSIAHVKTLTLGTWAITMLGVLHKNHLGPRSSKCECLTIDTELWKSHPFGIAVLLKYYPLLQTLIFSISPTPDFDDSWVSCDDDLALESMGEEFSVSPIPLSGLTHLKIVNFSWFWDDEYLNFDLVEILLKSAPMLQKMMIHMPTKNTRYLPERKQLLKASQKLLSFQRSYPHAELLVYE